MLCTKVTSGLKVTTALPLLNQIDFMCLLRESSEHTSRKEMSFMVVSMHVAKTPSVTTTKANIQERQARAMDSLREVLVTFWLRSKELAKEWGLKYPYACSGCVVWLT